MEGHLSPKDLALSIGVSESSLKRWVDDARLVAVRTSGGHRRIPLHEAIRFIRETGQSIVRPGLLGVPDLSADAASLVSQGHGEAELLRMLEAGKADEARGIILAHCLSAKSVASVCDGPISHAMHRIGELWRHANQHGIAIEHRATTTCLEAMHHIRMLLPPIDNLKSEPRVAVGGAMETDPYVLPTLMAATCLRELGWQDVNLGANTPVEALLEAARRHKARLVWLSASSCDPSFDLIGSLSTLAAGVAEMGASLLLGGRKILGLALPPMPSTHVVHSMSELASFARGVRARPPEVVERSEVVLSGSSNRVVLKK